MSVRRRLFMAAALLAAAAILVLTAACTDADSPVPPLCRAEGATSLCLRHGDADVLVSGEGFQPGSDVHVDVADGRGQLVPVADDGTFPAPGRTVGFLPGARAESHRLEGLDRTGRAVTYVVTCSVNPSKQPRCAF